MSSELRNRKLKIFTKADVASHNTENSCWVTIGRLIYDVTSFLNDHPGGEDLILKYGGKDVNEAMKGGLGEEHVHTQAAFSMMSEMIIGKVEQGARTVDESKFKITMLEIKLIRFHRFRCH